MQESGMDDLATCFVLAVIAYIYFTSYTLFLSVTKQI